MRLINGFVLLAAVSFSFSAAAVKVGEMPKDFSLKGHDGKAYKLSEFKKDHVVLEWYNDECPYVQKHYDASNMQNLQKTYTDKGVKWFSVISSAPGKQGHVDAKGAKKLMKQRKSHQTAILLDPEGKVGKYFGARTTPHMYIIEKGKLVYMGAIDDQPSARATSLKKAKPLFASALDISLQGKKIGKDIASTKPYGCSVKYK